MKVRIEIRSYFGKVLFEAEKEDYTIKRALQDAVLQGADLRGADLRGAVLQDADLRGIPYKQLPEQYINACSKDMLYIFEHLKSELPGLRKALVDGKINGTQYQGDCACLIGTLGGNTDAGAKKVCKQIPYYSMGLDNPGEQWFWQIRPGDTPKNNEFAKHAVTLIDSVLHGSANVKKVQAKS